MPDQDRPPQPDAAPKTTEENVDELLRSAELLTREIAAEAGVAPQDMDRAKGPVSADAADVTAAALLAEEQLEEIDRVLGEAPAPAPPSPSKPPPPRPEPIAPPATPKRSVEDVVAPRVASPAIEKKTPDALPVAEEPPPPAKPRVPVRRRVLRGIRGLARFALLAGPRLFKSSLLFIDWPFRKLGPDAKWRIGIVAIITTLMGTASLLLPRLLSHNPYLEMRPKPAEAEGGESQTSESQGGKQQGEGH